MSDSDEVLDERARQGVIEHMNADHPDALVLYAEVFGGIHNTRSAVLTDIDRHGMRMMVEDGSTTHDVHIPFEESLTRSSSVRAVLVDMVNRARLVLAARKSPSSK